MVTFFIVPQQEPSIPILKEPNISPKEEASICSWGFDQGALDSEFPSLLALDASMMLGSVFEASKKTRQPKLEPHLRVEVP